MNINYFGILTTSNNKEILFYAQSGASASRAWIESDAEYNQIIGQTFLAYTSDDGDLYNIGRKNIRRVKDENEINEFMSSACNCFRLRVKLLQYGTKNPKAYADSRRFIENVSHLLEKFSSQELEEFFITEYTEQNLE